MAVVIIHDFIPYVPPKPPATLPQPEETDIGKYLNVDSNVDLVYSSVENELPTPTADDNGKFVGVDDAKYKIVDAPTELPSVSSSDNGKFLGVSSGKWQKVSSPVSPLKTITILPGSVTQFPSGVTRPGLLTMKPSDNIVLKLMTDNNRTFVFSGIYELITSGQSGPVFTYYAVFSSYIKQIADNVIYRDNVFINCTENASWTTDFEKLEPIETATT